MKLLQYLHINELFTLEALFAILRFLAISVGGLALLKVLSMLTARLTRNRMSPQGRMVAQKTVVYAGGVIVLLNILALLGVNLNALLGAAGIAGIAIGFASQTSISNLISGLFLISEKPFAVGHVIQAGDTTGVVLSIDLMSVKIRTFDNQFVRIPNQELLNSKLTNVSRFPIRRMDIPIRVAYTADIQRVREVLRELARRNPYCLDEPEPLILLSAFGESSLEFLLGLWFVQSDFLVLKNSIMQEIKERFDAEGIRFGLPQRTLSAAERTPALPVRLEAGPDPAAAVRPAVPRAVPSSELRETRSVSSTRSVSGRRRRVRGA